MRFVLVCALCVMASVSAFADYTLAVFGDSLSAGYKLPVRDSFYAQLERALREKKYNVKVLNASKSGETTVGGLRKVTGLLAQKPNGVILELGINDSFGNVPIVSIRDNLQKLIDQFQNHQIEVLLVGMKTLPNKAVTYQKQFEEMYRQLATQNKLELYPFFMDGIFKPDALWNLTQKNENLLPNDVHPSAKGVAIMVRGVLPTIEKFLNRQGIFPKGY